MAASLTLVQYEAAERVLARVEARRGLAVHAIVTIVVWAVLVMINGFVADEFPWSLFAIGGMSIGLVAHYVFGVRLVDRTVREHQREVERLAERNGA